MNARAGFSAERLDALLARERARFHEHSPRALARAAELKAHWLHGAPSHWMNDWASPAPIFVDHGEGAALTDIDGGVYDDFCLGDTPGMFGHARREVAEALERQAKAGAGFMLPTQEAVEVGALLAQRFALPYWQTTLSASDANRAAIRWARAVTGKDVILVFDGCYHGMVEDCFVTLADGRARMDPGLIGQAHDYTRTTRVIPFNDPAALAAALAPGDVAAVLAEPVMTNCGMILPEPGFHACLRGETIKAGALLMLDETHTLSTGPGGYARAFGLDPDMLVIGKAIAGGFPAGVWGVTGELAARMNTVTRAPGRSGIGATLAGNALSIAAIGAMLRHVINEESYQPMLAGAERLVKGLRLVIAAHGLPWSVVHVGARAEIVFAPEPPNNAAAMRAAMADHRLMEALHLYLINRRILIAPFHNMMLVSPMTSGAQIDRLTDALGAFAQEEIYAE